MRLLSILTAIVVVLTLFLFVFQRDRLLGFAGVSAGDASVSDVSAPAEEQPETNERRVSVVALRSQAREIGGAVILRGRTEALRQVEVRAETSGRVISAPIRKGSMVAEGQLMCSLDPGTRQSALDDARAGLHEAKARLPESRARLAESEARLDEAEINDRAASRLSQEGFASETRVAATAASVEAARAGVQSAKSGVASAEAGIQSAAAAVASAENELAKLDIAAPFAGLLESDTAELGALLQPGSLCGTIIQLDTIRLVGFVPETLVDRVKPGSRAGARLSSGREVIGEVTFLSRSADPTTRTFRVDVEVSNADMSIRDGQTAEIAIEADGETAHLLPQSALTLDDSGQLGVRVVEDGRAGFAPVSVFRDTTEGIWITGLAPETDVIVVGQEFVTDGVPLEVSYREKSE
ncbi:MAG: efflux RND transporter periplasmic adaptor subunit [Silicimonas sp.]|nr:efflux RND transporter periplasmic adaptor subunit [Silicimonas sp.]